LENAENFLKFLILSTNNFLVYSDSKRPSLSEAPVPNAMIDAFCCKATRAAFGTLPNLFVYDKYNLC